MEFGLSFGVRLVLWTSVSRVDFVKYCLVLVNLVKLDKPCEVCQSLSCLMNFGKSVEIGKSWGVFIILGLVSFGKSCRVCLLLRSFQQQVKYWTSPHSI